MNTVNYYYLNLIVKQPLFCRDFLYSVNPFFFKVIAYKKDSLYPFLSHKKFLPFFNFRTSVEKHVAVLLPRWIKIDSIHKYRVRNCSLDLRYSERIQFHKDLPFSEFYDSFVFVIDKKAYSAFAFLYRLFFFSKLFLLRYSLKKAFILHLKKLNIDINWKSLDYKLFIHRNFSIIPNWGFSIVSIWHPVFSFRVVSNFWDDNPIESSFILPENFFSRYTLNYWYMRLWRMISVNIYLNLKYFTKLLCFNDVIFLIFNEFKLFNIDWNLILFTINDLFLLFREFFHVDGRLKEKNYADYEQYKIGVVSNRLTDIYFTNIRYQYLNLIYKGKLYNPEVWDLWHITPSLKICENSPWYYDTKSNFLNDLSFNLNMELRVFFQCFYGLREDHYFIWFNEWEPPTEYIKKKLEIIPVNYHNFNYEEYLELKQTIEHPFIYSKWCPDLLFVDPRIYWTQLLSSNYNYMFFLHRDSVVKFSLLDIYPLAILTLVGDIDYIRLIFKWRLHPVLNMYLSLYLKFFYLDNTYKKESLLHFYDSFLKPPYHNVPKVPWQGWLVDVSKFLQPNLYNYTMSKTRQLGHVPSPTYNGRTKKRASYFELTAPNINTNYEIKVDTLKRCHKKVTRRVYIKYRKWSL